MINEEHTKKSGWFVPILLIILTPMVMLYPLWFNPLSAGEDDVVYYYPLRVQTGQVLREGRWPVRSLVGPGHAPLMADPQTAVMFPTTWLFAVIDAKLAFSLSIFAAFSLAGGGAYLYLRRLGLMRSAATFGAVVFMFCGFMIGHRVHLTAITTAAFLPWGLWCIEGFRLRRASAFAWAVPVFFLAIVSGHWPSLIYLGIAWAAYVLLRGRPVLRPVLLVVGSLMLAALMAAPQLLATFELIGQSTRHRIGYATFGENSFFPPAGILALFPFLMGSRTPNVFAQSWWGPWHLCEMLGYVGLATLVLAVAAVWRLYRRPRDRDNALNEPLRPVVRVWAWVGLGGLIWMLGYYLPTYRLIHMIPMLNIVRCPARMVLVVDMALATLAAVAVHRIAQGNAPKRLVRSVRRGVTGWLPLMMVVVLAIVALAGRLLQDRWPETMPFFAGGAGDMLAAVRPTNPAVWVPLLLLVATIGTVLFWLRAPRRRTGVLIAMILVDLFVPSRFVDEPNDALISDTIVSPAADWLRRHDPPDGTYRIWGVSEAYHHRPAELLLSQTCRLYGIGSIAPYGPFLSPIHARLFGVNTYGYTGDWAGLLRRNNLLSLYGVKYILAADANVREVIESVRVVNEAPAEGPNLLPTQSEAWSAERMEKVNGIWRLKAPALWLPAEATCSVTLLPNTVYRIALESRGPDGGGANFLRAEVVQALSDVREKGDEAWQLTVPAEQITEHWRRFTWTFRTSAETAKATFKLSTMSERPIEVRHIVLRASYWDVPACSDVCLRPLAEGQVVYQDMTPYGLPPRRAGDSPVHIYRNQLVLPLPLSGHTAMLDNEVVELMRYPAGVNWRAPSVLPDLGFDLQNNPHRVFLVVTLPILLLYLLLAILLVRVPPAESSV